MNRLQCRCTSIRRGTVVLAGLLLFCQHGTAQSLLTNGSAETGDTSSWQVMHVRAVEEQSQQTGTVSPHEGDWFFTMSPEPASSASMWQTNALPSSVARLSFSGMVQTETLGGDDYGGVVLAVLSDTGHTVAAITNAQLASEAMWVPFDIQLDVPDDAASWRVDLMGTLVYGSYVNVFYDTLSLQGSGPDILITNIWSTASGRIALGWTSGSIGLSYTVESATSLTDSAFAPVLPTNQWPIILRAWTNSSQQVGAEFFRVKGKD